MMKQHILCQKSVVCFFPVCHKGPKVKFVNRGVGPPSTAGRRLPQLRALEQNARGSTEEGGPGGLKALSLVHCFQVAPGFLATRLTAGDDMRHEEHTKEPVFLR